MTEKMKKIVLYLSLLAVAAFTAMLLAVAANAQSWHGDIPVEDLSTDRQALWKEARYCASADADSIEVKVQYRKKRELMCIGSLCYFGFDADTRRWRTEIVTDDNDPRLNKWHDTLTYSGIPHTDGGSKRVFSRDGISGSFWSSGVNFMLNINKPGKVVHAANRSGRSANGPCQ